MLDVQASQSAPLPRPQQCTARRLRGKGRSAFSPCFIHPAQPWSNISFTKPRPSRDCRSHLRSTSRPTNQLPGLGRIREQHVDAQGEDVQDFISVPGHHTGVTSCENNLQGWGDGGCRAEDV